MLAWIIQVADQVASGATSDSAAKWGVLSLLVTNLGLVVLALIHRKDIKQAKDVAVSTNESVNHVEKGEPNLINKMRGAETDIKYLKESYKWSREVLTALAHSVGIRVPPAPIDPEDQTKEDTP